MDRPNISILRTSLHLLMYLNKKTKKLNYLKNFTHCHLLYLGFITDSVLSTFCSFFESTQDSLSNTILYCGFENNHKSGRDVVVSVLDCYASGLGLIPTTGYLVFIRSFSPCKAMTNQLVVLLPSKTSLLSRSEPALNCRSHLPTRESMHKPCGYI